MKRSCRYPEQNADQPRIKINASGETGGHMSRSLATAVALALTARCCCPRPPILESTGETYVDLATHRQREAELSLNADIRILASDQPIPPVHQSG
jgi:hypothetical protein